MEKLEAFAKATGQDIPALRERVDHDPAHRLYWLAYMDLRAYRSSSGFGVAAIPLSDVLLYARLHGFSDLRRFARIIAAMDVAERNSQPKEKEG